MSAESRQQNVDAVVSVGARTGIDADKLAMSANESDAGAVVACC